jgi:hypothetical protein
MPNGHESIWHGIISTISDDEYEIPTTTGHWFRTFVDHGSVYISHSVQHAPSCRLPARRRISMHVFFAIYPYFERWAKGEQGIRADSEHMSRESACVFAIAGHFHKADGEATGNR